MEDLRNQPTSEGDLDCPTWLKLSYTAFMAVLIPYYLHAYGPANLLWICDVALIVTLVALWKNSRFLLSTQAVAIVVPQLIWCLDFAYQATTGDQILGAARYMFNPQISVFVRVLSLFHVWMPAMLLWLVWKNGYDRSAWKMQVAILWCVLLTIFCCLDAPQSASQNINKVFGWGDTAQTLMPPILWLTILMAAFPLGIYLPSHLVFKHVFQAECATAKPCLAETAA